MSSNTPTSQAPTARPSGRRRTAVVTALALALLLASCGSDEDSLGGKVVKDGLGCTVSSVARKSEAPKIATGVKVGKETKTKDLVKPGKKACTADGEHYLTVDLIGATAKDAKTFNSTFGTKRPITVRLGQGQLIQGLETALNAMKVGTRRQIVVPAVQAYGKDGLESEGIGKNADLVFVVDLVSLTDSPVYCNEAINIPKGVKDGKPTKIDMPEKAPVKKVITTVLTPGDGATATKKSYLTVDYVGVSCGNGQQFDSSWDRADPIQIALVDAEPNEVAFSVIPGWSSGLVGQKAGSTVQVDIPFEQAYGVEGQAPSIGPSDPLTFIVKILKVSQKAPVVTTTTYANPEGTTTTAAG